MSCIISNGYTLPCKGIAGVQAVFIGEYNDGSLGYTYGATAGVDLNQIIAFTGATVSFYKFEQTIETGSLTETGNFNEQNGTAYYDQVVEITVHNVGQELIDQVNTLGRGRWRIIVLDVNGNYFLVGKINPVSVTAATGGLGKAYGDLNGYTLTFTGKEYDALVQVTTSAAITVIS
jgi:hypothetical protein